MKYYNCPKSSSLFSSFQGNTKCESSLFADTCTLCVPIFIFWNSFHLINTFNEINNSELKQVTFLTTRTSTGSKVNVFHQSQPLIQSSDVTHAVRVVKNVTCLSSLLFRTTEVVQSQNKDYTEAQLLGFSYDFGITVMDLSPYN
jgi:hypothetical protein